MDLILDSVSEAQEGATERLSEDIEVILDSSTQVSQIEKRTTLAEP